MSEGRWKFRVLALAAVVGAGMPLLTACREKGPVEKAGEKVDKTVDKVQDAIDPKGPAEEAGEKIDKALGD